MVQGFKEGFNQYSEAKISDLFLLIMDLGDRKELLRVTGLRTLRIK